MTFVADKNTKKRGSWGTCVRTGCFSCKSCRMKGRKKGPSWNVETATFCKRKRSINVKYAEMYSADYVM